MKVYKSILWNKEFQTLAEANAYANTLIEKDYRFNWNEKKVFTYFIIENNRIVECHSTNKKIQECNLSIAKYKEMYFAIIALESNINVDSIEQSIRLHTIHKDIIKLISEIVYSEFGAELQKADAIKVASLMINKDYVFETDRNVSLCLPSLQKGESLFFEYTDDNLESVYLELPSKTTYLDWDEDNPYGYQREDPKIEDHRDIQYEKFLKNMGLTPHYEIVSTYHSRSVVLYGI